MENSIDNICISLYLKEHPILSESDLYREQYLSALCYFVDRFSDIGDTAQSFYLCYAKAFLPGKHLNGKAKSASADMIKPVIDTITKTKFRSNKRFSYRYIFVADCLFLCAFRNEQRAKRIIEDIKVFFNPWYHRELDVLYETLYHSAPLERNMNSAKAIVERWHENIAFLSQTPERILITAMMSAGKSTIINAIIGESLARTAQEACTGDLHYYYNRPFDDRLINCMADREFYGIDAQDLFKEKARINAVATFFRTFVPSKKRVCIIDSPGVNSAINQSHRRVTQNAVREANYDKLIYIFNAAGGLGREEEALYLKFIFETVPHEKTIFVINKLDAFRKSEDSITGSIHGIKSDLKRLGYANPCVCPVSSYFGLLIKKRMQGIELDEDEQEEFDRYIRRFNKPEYDLSSYYDIPANLGGDPLTTISIRCGLYGLEKTIMGG